MTKDQKTIKEQATQITDLTKELERLKSDNAIIQKYKEQYDNELKDIHETFDLLGVPRHPKNTYRDLSVNARLTLFLAKTSGLKVEQLKEEED